MIQVYDFQKEFGTHKAVGVEEVVEDALRKGIDIVSVISHGNYFRALSQAADRLARDKLRVVNLVNWRPQTACEVQIEDKRILRDSREREAYLAQRLTGAGKIADYTDFIPEALRTKAREVVASAPNYVSLGIGSGKLFVTLLDAVRKKQLKTRLVGIVPKGVNGVFPENNLLFRDGNLFFRQLPDTIADCLATPYTSFAPEIRGSREEGHLIYAASNPDFSRAWSEASAKGHISEYGGSAGFVLCNPNIRHDLEIREDSDVLVINTGRGY